MQFFYEKSKFSDFKSNTTYHQLLSMTDGEFVEWARLLRKEVVDQWDNDGIPPVTGKTKEALVSSFFKLKSDDVNIWKEDNSDEESLGTLKNFNKDQSAVNHFFPTMLKTRISDGASHEGGRSIYDYFALDELEENFIKVMKRAVYRDSMYAWSRSLTSDKDENPFWNGQKPVDFLKEVHEGSVFIKNYKNIGLNIMKTKESSIKKYGKCDSENRTFGKIFYLTSEELQSLLDEGYVSQNTVKNTGTIEDSITLKNGNVVRYFYTIRWYDKTEGIFPKLVQAFRLGLGQPAVNFPALTAKWIYENYTSHIKQDEPVIIYDSSSGWGGRIIGAMSARKKIHYVGTDPNPDNFIDELGISRYEYMAKFYNDTCVDNYSDTFNKFFSVESNSNTYELFQDGSELIHLNPNFQKYKGKLDFAFTSPPYFNREQYSQDEKQSFLAYSQYDDWRDNFLKPTLTTIYEYLKNDRYILWNIASIKINKTTYFDLEGDSIKILEDLGCEYKGKLKMLMASMVGQNVNKRESIDEGIKNVVKVDGTYYKYEPIFVFRKK